MYANKDNFFSIGIFTREWYIFTHILTAPSSDLDMSLHAPYWIFFHIFCVCMKVWVCTKSSATKHAKSLNILICYVRLLMFLSSDDAQFDNITFIKS